MSLVLRIGLILVSLLTLIFITRKVRNAQVKLEDLDLLVHCCWAAAYCEYFPADILCGISLRGH